MALLTAVIWGTTYLATQELLAVYTPMQIMLMRFAIAYVMLWLLCPHPLRLKWRDEGFCLLLGIIGCTLYFLSEVYSLACGAQSSTLSIFFAASPIVTALLVWFFIPKERPRKTIFIGFAVALVGVVLVVYNGHIQMQFSLAGYLLALCSCICWGTYSFLLRKKAVAINGLQLTRRIIFWGFLTTLPVCLI